MTCYSPLTGYFSKTVNPSGKRSIVFDSTKSHSGVSVDLPCGQCIGCRLERSRVWAIRCMHEKRLHRESAFITLTYDDKKLPENGTLVRRDAQLFMKRLRKVRPSGIRFFGCGEYGETLKRPHYHILLLNTDFGDKRYWKQSGSGNDLYVSKELEKLWPDGHSYVGNVSFDSCAYVARYCVKKINGPEAEAYYAGRLPEFSMCSLKPGIGSGWFKKYQVEAFKHDSVIMNGKEVSLPRYYDEKYLSVDANMKPFRLVDTTRVAVLKKRRAANGRKHADNNTPARLRVREEFDQKVLARFKRDV